jgi:hypothetical protein
MVLLHWAASTGTQPSCRRNGPAHLAFQLEARTGESFLIGTPTALPADSGRPVAGARVAGDQAQLTGIPIWGRG